MQNEKKKLDLQITGMEARYRAETEQLKLQNEQLNAQVDELQAQEESHTEDVENLRAQLENLKESEQALKEQTEKLKAEVGLKVARACQKRGLIARPLGNVLILSPTLIMDEPMIDEIEAILRDAIEEVAAGL